MAETVMEEPENGHAVFDGIVSGDRKGVALVIQAICPLVVDAVHERLVGIVERRFARVLHPRIGVGDAACKTVLKRMTEAHLKSVVDGACIVWSKKLVYVGEC